jgi:large subunit ribosomal protein L15
MRLHDLRPRPGAKHRRKRLGSGESSGHGKTSGRGGKGQTARSGSSIRIGFEGGQMPLIRRLPKRGFNNAAFTTRYLPVNLEALNSFDSGAMVDETAIRNAGLANGKSDGIKILGDGDLKKKLTVRAHAFSKSAKEKIEGQGGTCELVGPKAAAAQAPAKPKREPKAQKTAAAPVVERETPGESTGPAEGPAKETKPKKSDKAPKEKK